MFSNSFLYILHFYIYKINLYTINVKYFIEIFFQELMSTIKISSNSGED